MQARRLHSAARSKKLDPVPIHNADIAAMFDEMAELLELKEENPFRIRAYRTAARTLREHGQEMADLVARGADLTEIQGIGKTLAEKIQEIITTGRLKALESLRAEFPRGLVDLLRIPGLGPKKVAALHRELGIAGRDQLEQAAREGRVAALKGFGEKTQAQILKALRAQAAEGKRFRRAVVEPYAEALLAYLRRAPGVTRAEAAGSYRRGKETVGDLDILVAATAGGPVMERFAAYDEVASILAQGETRSSVVLKSGIPVDLRAVSPESFGAAWQDFTGSKAHNLAVRAIADDRGLKLNEYGLFRGEGRIAGATEEEVYAALGLACPPPELREDRGEVRTATLPKLIVLSDLKGDLHTHTSATDGRNSLREMAEAARVRGLEYLAITDHSQSLRVAKGLQPKALIQHLEAIDRLNRELDGITLLKGLECDILEDGRLDMDDDVLRRLDLVVGAVHSHFDLPREKQTDRILRAMDHPCFTILAHPTGRLLLSREPYDVDLERILLHAKERGVFVELDAHPERLDLNDVHARMAKAAGVLVAIDSDAHSVIELENLRHGVMQARRGWLEAGDVLNTRTLAELRLLLARARR